MRLVPQSQQSDSPRQVVPAGLAFPNLLTRAHLTRLGPRAPLRAGMREAAPEQTPQGVAQPLASQFVHSEGIPRQLPVVANPQPQHKPSFLGFGAIFVKGISKARFQGLIEQSLTKESRYFLFKANWITLARCPLGMVVGFNVLARVIKHAPPLPSRV